MAYAGVEGLCLVPIHLIQTETPVGFACSNHARSTIMNCRMVCIL
jgi:hypothetical protein